MDEKTKGKRCPDCGEEYEEPVGYNRYSRREWFEGPEDLYDEVPHADMRDCIRHLKSALENHSHGSARIK